VAATRPPTLTAALELAAARGGRGYRHQTDDKTPIIDVPHAELLGRASRFAAALQHRGLVKGDRVGLILPNSHDFIDALFGCMLAGIIPVPVYPPMNLGKLDSYLQNTTHVLTRAGCGLVVTDGRVRPILGQVMANTAAVREIVTHDKLVAEVDANGRHRDADIKPDDIAFLQFTSGSTSHPKGVTLTHANLLANIRGIGTGLTLSDESVGVSWLPLYHDMGLIGFVFTPIVVQAKLVHFMSPLMFLKRPGSWLRAISENEAHISFAPNFAYGLATKRVRDKDIEGVDLSSLRVAGCGAEPIQHDTLRGFADRFAGHGFRSTMFLPCYGMAEHSLAITFVGLEDDLEADTVRAAAVAEGRAEPAEPNGEGTVKFVNCGRPFAEHEVQIRSDQGEPLGEREIGEIMLRGPSIMVGYFEDQEATARALEPDGWLHTGDLGYLVDGSLYVCGRIKDLIIVNGRNYYPQDVEWQASQVDGVRKGNVIAFGVPDPESARERVVVAAESRSEEEGDRIRGEVAERVAEALNLKVDEILLLPPGSLPKTSSGKLQRRKARQMFLDADLGKVGGAGAWATIKALANSRWGYLKSALGGR